MTPSFKVPGTDTPGRPNRRPLSRLTLHKSADSDVARAPYVPYEPARRGSGGPYTDAFKAVEASYEPGLYSQYR